MGPSDDELIAAVLALACTPAAFDTAWKAVLDCYYYTDNNARHTTRELARKAWKANRKPAEKRFERLRRWFKARHFCTQVAIDGLGFISVPLHVLERVMEKADG